MSVLRTKRNEAYSLYVFNCIDLYKYLQLHLRNVEKKFNAEKNSIINSCDKLIESAIFAYKIIVTNKHEYQLKKDYLIDMACWLEKIDVMLTIIRNDNGIKDRILIPCEALIQKELILIKKEQKKNNDILNNLITNN